MNKGLTMFVSMLLVFSMISFVSAEEVEIKEAGRVPGDAFYGLDRAFDAFRLSLTFTPEKRVERAMLVAEERLAEYERLVELNETERAERVLASYNRMIERSDEIMDRIASGEDPEEGFRSAAKLEERIAAHAERVDEIYARILEKHGENMTEEELERLDAHFERIRERSVNVSDRALERKERMRTKHKVLSELSDEELAELELRIEDEEGINKSRADRMARHERRLNRTAHILERRPDRAERILEGDNVSAERRVRTEERIAFQEDRLDRINERLDSLEDEDIDLPRRPRRLPQREVVSGDAATSEVADREAYAARY